MDKLVIEGGRKLHGDVKISGAKNSVLPIMAATLLTDENCTIRNGPKLRDSLTMIKLLRSLGKIVETDKDKVMVAPNPRGEEKYVADYKLVSTMRGSFCVLGPLLAKLKKAKVSLPGGCIIGVRPVDLHLKGIRALGAKMEFENGYIHAHAHHLKGAHVYLGGEFGSSVLATANILMAATLANGETMIESAACEPEVEDLTNFLIGMGANIKGKGGHCLTVKGVKRLKGFNFKIIPDRIEAGTYILMAAATKSSITLRNACVSHLMVLKDKLELAGVQLAGTESDIIVRPRKRLRPVGVTTHPYPGFPTDLQAQFMALMSVTPGVSVISDKVYPDRFMHIAELNR